MQRRNFFTTIGSGVVALLTRRLARAQDVKLESVRELAGVVLPSSLGRERTEKIARGFVTWFGEYKPGTQVSSGYGHPRTQVTGASPSAHYEEQIIALGSPITREAVAKALEEAQIDRVPQRPNGKHVAADLLAYFYASSEGEDFLYGVAIKRDDCRGLSDSDKQPARFS